MEAFWKCWVGGGGRVPFWQGAGEGEQFSCSWRDGEGFWLLCRSCQGVWALATRDGHGPGPHPLTCPPASPS